ncbi:fibronectin type III domain-containing protein [Tenacibaculum sp. M341]|uniref:fibronectin type III domain-containing protein n=1 Tax=Tenacibaculum sp. M341 TaxID=2530339 RepID=UPI001045CEAC|nr:fibronectin type III domain-containing protein [Tenacibaculum sp. M341]TCI92161.1 T9SS type A sorting domain-containing protein [Tenacibaculum sp. M341]
MIKNFKFLIGGVSLALISSIGYQGYQSIKEKREIEEKRQIHAEFLKNSPYNETLKWDKKTRKLNGLPPNRYFEQMWELTMNPATGKTEDDKLIKLREELMARRAAQRAPGDDDNAWVERGPNNVGGRTRVIMFDPNDATNRRVYAGGVSGGLWVNNDITNANSQWQRIQNVPGNLSVTSITVDPRNSNTWYVGTGEQYTAGDVVGNGVYRTVDGGTTWRAINIPAAGGGDINVNAGNVFLSGIHYVNDILAWDNGSSTELFVAVGAHVYGDSSDPTNWLGLQSAGLYRSTNNGTTWNRIEGANMRYEFGGNNYYFIPNDLEVGADNRLWLGTITSPGLGEGGGRIFSSNNGGTWTEAAASPLVESNRVELEPSAIDRNRIYALAQGTTRANPVRIFETTNAFNTVRTLALPNDADTGIPANDFCRGQAFYDLVIEADPNDDDVVYVGGIDLFRTTNGGTTWNQISQWRNLGLRNVSLVHADQHSIAFANNSSTRMLFGNDGGVYYSNNSGGTINARNRGYNVTQFVKAAIGPDGRGDRDGIFTAGAQDNGTQAFRNANAGVNASVELSDGDGFYTFVDKDGQFMISTFTNNVIYRFNLPWNGRSRLQGGATVLSQNQNTGSFVNEMDFDSDANRLLSNNTARDNAGNVTVSILSINVANNSNGTLTNANLDAAPTAFRASPFTNNRWFVGLANGSLLRLSNVTNSTATFTEINTPFVGSVSSVRFGATENDIFVTIHNYGVVSVWSTNNGGTTWVSREGDLPNIPVRDILQNPLDRDEAIIATQLGVWSTSNFNDANPNWTQAYNGMSDVSVTSFDYWNVNGNNTENRIIASTYGRGVFTGTFTGTATAPPPTGSCTSTVNTFPYSQGFESGDGWTQVGGDDGQWLRDSGGTPSNNTGPSAATQGSFYMYLEASTSGAGQIGSNATAILESPCFDLSGVSSANFTFSNHMFGNNVGSLTAQVSTDGTTWTNVWTQSGSQGNQWNDVAVNLGTYIGSTVRIRLVGVTGNGWSSDIAIDNLAVTTASGGGADTQAPSRPTNIQASNVTATTATISWNASTDNVGVTEYDIYQGSTNIGSVANTTANITGLTSGTSYTFSIRAKDAAGNESAASNTVSFTTTSPISCTSTVSSFPYSQGFESGAAWTQVGGDDGDWLRNSGGTPSRETGPSAATEGSFYMYIEGSTSGAGQIGSNATAILESPCFDLSGASSANFTFSNHMLGTNIGSLTVQASTDGTTWTNVWTDAGNQGNQWNNVTVNLNTYAGAVVKLRFVGSTGNGWRSDIAIDNLAVTTNNTTAATSADVSDFSTLEDNEPLKLLVYPNPSIDFIQVKLNRDDITLSSFRIVNNVGAVVKKGNLTGDRLDITDLSSGIYMLEVTDGQEGFKTKLVKR